MSVFGNVFGGGAGVFGSVFGDEESQPVVVSDLCWNGTPSQFETRLLAPQPNYAIEQFRLRFLRVVVENAVPKKAARTVLQMALETEVAAVVTKLVDVMPDIQASVVCERRRYLEIDVDMRLHRYLIEPFLKEVSVLPEIPSPYVDLMRRYARSAYPRYRMSALAAALCAATAVLP